jgi:hypothetical protein
VTTRIRLENNNLIFSLVHGRRGGKKVRELTRSSQSAFVSGSGIVYRSIENSPA